MTYKCYKGSTFIPRIYDGSQAVKKIYKGSTLVWQLYDPTPVRFNYTGNFQTYVVPTGVGHLRFEVVAARGMATTSTNIVAPGKGGKVTGILTVSQNQKLYIYVGGTGTTSGSAISTPVYNASDIRTSNEGITNTTSLQHRLIVAGGGGNGANTNGGTANQDGGAGGGLTGGNSLNPGTGGYGGTQTAGGAAGNGYDGHPGQPGGFGLGGSATGFNVFFGGAGGAGWYGGGGSGSYWYASWYANVAGGAGGSSYTHPSLCTSVVHSQGVNAGNGYVILTPMD